MAKKRRISMRKVKKLSLLIAAVLIGLIAIIFFVKFITNKKPLVTKVVDKLSDYGYVLNDNETTYYNGLFKDLKVVLKQSEVDEEAYAALVGKLFLADFFNLDNKINKNDVGGIQFVYEDYQADFTKYALDTVYHIVKNNTYGDRQQELPIVTSVDVVNIKQQTYSYTNKTIDKNSFILNLTVNYKKDLGYQKDVTLVMIHDNNKLVIADM